MRREEGREMRIDPKDYLEQREREIFNAIWEIGQNGKPDDNVKLKALTKLYDKIRPDRTKMEMDIKVQAPYDLLLKNLKRKKSGK